MSDSMVPSTPPAEPDPGSAEIEVSIVIPCHNERDAVEQCVHQARTVLESLGYAGEVIVVDNDSDDDTAPLAREAGATVVVQSIRGYGAACLRGFEIARGRILIIADGDGTYDLSILHRFVEPLRAGYDMVLGTRRNGEILPGAMRRRHRHLLEPLQTHLARRFLPFAVSDVRCGMRGIRRDALSKLRLGSVGMEFATEMLLEAARAGLATVEVPVSFGRRRSDTHRRSVGDGWRVARFLLLVSPTRLFVVPGLLMLVMGLSLELSLLPGPIAIGRHHVDYHFMFVGSAAAILGLQLIMLGIFAKTYALVHGGLSDPWIVRFNFVFSLERGILLGVCLASAGFLINFWILASWIAQGAGVIFAVRPAITALTLMVLGTEIVFASFFLAVLRQGRFTRP